MLRENQKPEAIMQNLRIMSQPNACNTTTNDVKYRSISPWIFSWGFQLIFCGHVYIVCFKESGPNAYSNLYSSYDW